MSVLFNNTADILQRTASLPSGSTFTVTMWVRLEVDTSAVPVRAPCFDATGTFQGVVISTPSNTLVLAVQNASGPVINMMTMSLNTWYFIAVVNSAGSGTAYWSGAGGAGTLSTGTGTLPTGTPNKLNIGNSSLLAGTANVWQGSIAAVKLWSGAALSAADIENERWSYLPRRHANLYGFWPMRDSAEATLDLSTNLRPFTSGGVLDTSHGPPLAWAGPGRRALIISAGGGSAYTASLSETLSLSESLAAIYGAKPAVSESSTLSEALASLYRANAAVSETLSLSEARSTVYSARPSVSETITLVESTSGLMAAHVGISESVSLAESLAAGLSFRATLTETLSLAESLASLYSGRPALSDTVAVAEALAVVRATVAAISETLSLSDSVSGTRRVVVGLSETVSLVEALASRFAGHSALSESLSLSEAVEELQVFLSQTVIAHIPIAGPTESRLLSASETTAVLNALSVTGVILTDTGETNE